MEAHDLLHDLNDAATLLRHHYFVRSFDMSKQQNAILWPEGSRRALLKFRLQ